MEQVKETDSVVNTGLSEYQKLKKDAKSLGINDKLSMPELKEAVAKKAIEVRLRYEHEVGEILKHEYKMKLARAEIIAESESLCIPIDLPVKPTELDLAKARRLLGIKKKEPKPSPETLAIEASDKGYYIFTNREQDDVDISAIPGGKYQFDLIPDQIHVLPDWLTKFWRRTAVHPVYSQVPRADGKGGDCVKTGDKPRFTFEYLGKAPQNAKFGVVRDEKILKELKPKE